jgi:glutathione peroxidase
MSNAYAHEVRTIDGQTMPLEGRRGQVSLFVNVASRCGYTRQYAGLEALHKKFKDQGFAVLGFPSNDFGAQEPGTEAEIKAFCSTKYDVTFPMFAKVKVKGPERAPLYATLGDAAGAPKWNFHKFLVGKDGRVLQAFQSGTEPDDDDLIEAIERALET